MRLADGNDDHDNHVKTKPNQAEPSQTKAKAKAKAEAEAWAQEKSLPWMDLFGA